MAQIFVNMGVGGFTLDSKRILLAAKELIKNRLKNENITLKLKAAFLPAGGRKRPIAKDRVLLIGDSAGLVDAFSGEGVYYAITSAKIAAQVIPKKDRMILDYERQCYKLFLNEF